MGLASDYPVILITGGSRGIGAATARLAAQQGYNVVLSYVARESDALAVVTAVEAAGRQALAVKADCAEPEQISRLFEQIDQRFGRIDVLVNNAGVLFQQSRLEDLSFERMQRTFAVNTIGPMLCAQHAAKHMAYCHGGQGGSVVNVSSIAAKLGSQSERIRGLRRFKRSIGDLHNGLC